eukprot:6204119-Pleurochrysis_carterae.AAC.1
MEINNTGSENIDKDGRTEDKEEGKEKEKIYGVKHWGRKWVPGDTLGLHPQNRGVNYLTLPYFAPTTTRCPLEKPSNGCLGTPEAYTLVIRLPLRCAGLAFHAAE